MALPPLDLPYERLVAYPGDSIHYSEIAEEDLIIIIMSYNIDVIIYN
jgi:hypothetical protein